ncbi:MAG: hypothetical protein LAP21_13110 [Acidobacteriia bacterium]|nr:hypothetical protein [Terriglobia bacterium]
MPELLRLIFKVRAERYAYMRSEPGVNPGDQADVLRMLESAGVERACILDWHAHDKYVPLPSAAE